MTNLLEMPEIEIMTGLHACGHPWEIKGRPNFIAKIRASEGAMAKITYRSETLCFDCATEKRKQENAARLERWQKFLETGEPMCGDWDTLKISDWFYGTYDQYGVRQTWENIARRHWHSLGVSPEEADRRMNAQHAVIPTED
jgi:hypothetical protein